MADADKPDWPFDEDPDRDLRQESIAFALALDRKRQSQRRSVRRYRPQASQSRRILGT